MPVGFRAAKPPVETFWFDARVRNPLPHPIWLVFNAHNVNGGFPKSINAISLAKTTEKPQPYLWSFYGRGSMDAVRIAAHADIVIRKLEHVTSADEELMTLILAKEATVAGQPAVVWMGKHDELPAHGEVDMEWLRVDTSRVTPDTFFPVRVDTICSCQIQIRGQIGKRRL